MRETTQIAWRSFQHKEKEFRTEDMKLIDLIRMGCDELNDEVIEKKDRCKEIYKEMSDILQCLISDLYTSER